MNKILVIGCFGDKTGRLDGQINKTNTIYTMMKERLDKNSKLDYFNTLSVEDNIFLIFKLIVKLIWCNTAVLIPANHSLEIFFPFLYYFSKVARYKIIHICVGGWQLDFFFGGTKFTPHPLQMKLSKKCFAIIAEVKMVYKELTTTHGFTNCDYLPNFRRFKYEPLLANDSETLKLVYFGRVNKQKGYDIIFGLADYIVKNSLNITISFYGRIEPSDEKDFLEKVSAYSELVNYGGMLKDEEITTTMRKYDVMLLPTRYYTEGVSGTMLDGYIAGIPIIATDWLHAHDYIENGYNGFIVPFDNPQSDFIEKVKLLYKDRKLLRKMKEAAHETSKEYSEENAWSILSKYFK